MSRKERKAKAELRRQKYRNLILDGMSIAAKAKENAFEAGDVVINELIKNCPQDKDVILQSALLIRDAFVLMSKKE